MKSYSKAMRIISLASTGLLLTGCLLRQPTVSPRQFILAPMATTNESAVFGSDHLSIAVGYVKLPSYLLPNSMAIRNGANEIQYLENAQWGERLDQSFQRAVAVNLSRLLPSSTIYFSDHASDPAQRRIVINVQEFDLDSAGHGTLIANWKVTNRDDAPSTWSENITLYRTIDPPKNNPQAVAEMLSELTLDFSRKLAEALHHSTGTGS